MRFIDWNKGNPYIFRSIDFEQLMSSDRMFARKFDEKVDFDIVERIFEALDKQKRFSMRQSLGLVLKVKPFKIFTAIHKFYPLAELK